MKNFEVTMNVGLQKVIANVSANNAEQAKVLALQSVKVCNVETLAPILCHNPSHNKDLVALMNCIVAEHIITYNDGRFQVICCALASRDFEEMRQYVNFSELEDGIDHNELSDAAIDVLINNVCDDVDLAEIIVFVCRNELKEQDWKAISKVFA